MLKYSTVFSVLEYYQTTLHSTNSWTFICLNTNDNDNDNILFDHNVQIEITIFNIV